MICNFQGSCESVLHFLLNCTGIHPFPFQTQLRLVEVLFLVSMCLCFACLLWMQFV